MTIENIKESHFVGLLKKYALLLLVSAIISLALNILTPIVIDHFSTPLEYYNSVIYPLIPLIIRFSLNIITLVLVIIDSKTLSLRIGIIAILILFEREIGVALFLLLALYEERGLLLKKSVNDQ